MNNSLPQKAWLGWSSGKDSYAALRQLWADNQYRVESVFTVVDATTNSIPMHGISTDLMVQQVRAIGLEHRLVPLCDREQGREMRDLITDAQSRGVRFFAFGDLFLDDIRRSREQNMANTGIRTAFPLWQKPTKSLVLDLIKSGMQAVITSVDLTALPASLLGRELTVALIEELIGLGCDPCGENGEYHSFVFDGPLFNYRVRFERGEPRIGKDFAHLPLVPRPPTLSIDDVRSNLSTTGFAVVPSDKFVATLQDTSSCLVRLANAFRSTHAEVRDVPNLTTLREVLSTGLSQNDAVAHAVVEQVLETAHESIVQVREDIVPALAKLARSLGFDVDPQRAIARFRIATSSQSDYDHLWHQDSVDPPSVSNGERTLNLGFWIPLHDIGSDGV